MAIVNTSSAILYTTHLYNALLQEKTLVKSWKDMDLAFMMHRTEDMFIVSKPVTLDDYYKRYMLAMGYSAINFAPKKGLKRVFSPSKAGPRMMNTLSPVSRMFMPRFKHECSVTKFSPRDLETILEKYDEKDTKGVVYYNEAGHEVSRRVHVTVMHSDSTNEVKAARLKLYSRQNKEKTSNILNDGVQPIQLLNALLGVLRAETPELAFDHLRLHVACCRLLQLIQEELQEDLLLVYGDESVGKDKALLVVGLIFATWLNMDEFAGTTSNVVGPDGMQRRLLKRAAKLVRKMIESTDSEIVCSSLEASLGSEVYVPDVVTGTIPGFER